MAKCIFYKKDRCIIAEKDCVAFGCLAVQFCCTGFAVTGRKICIYDSVMY